MNLNDKEINEGNVSNENKLNKKVAIYTLGCKVNAYESSVMAESFKKAGYEVVDYSEVADVYIVNTCTVTNMSDRKSRQILRRAKELNQNSVLCAVGCYAQVAAEDLAKIQDIDIILGTNDKRQIVSIVEDFMKSHQKQLIVTIVLAERKYVEWGKTAITSKARAEIKVQDGCDRYCSYCIIPYARGPVRSRKKEDVHDEIIEIAKTGIKEIVITGIHISSYGKDLEDKPKLIDLLEYIHKIPGIERIRLGSLEPLIIDEDFVRRLKALPKVCNHFHLSLQSGCDSTLERMNRRYKTEDFRRIVRMLRENIPEVALTTDVIVGFPGETEEEFETTYEFLKEIRFSKMHVFQYSPRKGTKAEKFPNQVDTKIKAMRSARLIELSNQNEEEFAFQYIGKEIEVLFENEHDGHTTNYIEVYSKEEMKPNEIVVKKVKSWENGKVLV
ncbi:MAG: tRNA (N(6)-L-threonylcarbamoyladenosine(37)-C(2))-methylthiotransferase MtaB [Clostridia bacterium]|nr:tRNA (N(6)-L-threonylcarbamoyladenosine(37)-C(2))-methylthiotransferase MtaB [Clostridia bacterium]